MKGLRTRILDHAASVLPPALVLLLLGIQVAFGLRGFDRPDDSLLYVLQVPGVLLGWGGVALLVPLLAWMIMDWWGYDLNGFALKGLGSAVLGIALGTLVGIAAGRSSGGLVGAGLAEVLTSTLGSTFAVVLMLLMAGPAGVLALSMQRPATRPTSPRATSPRMSDASGDPEQESAREAKPVVGRLLGRWRRERATPSPADSRPWYPERRYDAQGNELPIRFGRERDIGGIRFLDADEAEPAEAPVATGAPVPAEARPGPEAAPAAPARAAQDAARDDEDRLPTIPELLSGRFDRSRLPPGDEDDDDNDARPGRTLMARAAPADEPTPPGEDAEEGAEPLHVDSEGRPVVQRRQAPPAAPVLRAPEPAAPPPPRVVAPVEPPAPAPAAASKPAPPLPDAVASTRAAALSFVPSDPGLERGPPPLLPGVRYADERPTDPAGAPSAANASSPDGRNGQASAGRDAPAARRPQALSASIQNAVRGPVRTAQPPSASGQIDALRDTLRTSFANMHDGDSGERYLAKLEAIGMFAAVDPPPAQSAPAAAAPTPAETTSGAANATRARRKPAARKRASRQTTAAKSTPGKGAPAGGTSPKGASAKGASAKEGASAKKGSATSGARKGGGTSHKRVARAEASGKAAGARAVAKAAAAKKAVAKRPTRKPPAAPAPPRASDVEAAQRQRRVASLRGERTDPLFVRAVETALERGAASPVLFTRRLGLPYDRACAMVDRLKQAGILGEPTASGAHPLTLSPSDWEASQ